MLSLRICVDAFFKCHVHLLSFFRSPIERLIKTGVFEFNYSFRDWRHHLEILVLVHDHP